MASAWEDIESVPNDEKVAFGGRLTAIGLSAFVVVPSPSCPKLFRPQESTVPFGNRAEEKYSPAEIDDGVAVIEETTGVVEDVVVPLPNWP
jgi:hypothetical protein